MRTNLLHIGIDDTDSRGGMCTTFLASETLREFPELDLIGYPRLVRLNPNIPWKTRGNGAIALTLGRGEGPPFPVGEVDGRTVHAYPGGRGIPPDKAHERRLRRLLEGTCVLDDPTTNPGYALLSDRPDPHLYWRCVRDVVSLPEALSHAEGRGVVGGFKTGRGRIGALAALSWIPRDRTYEVLAYRDRGRWTTPRDIEEASVVDMDRQFPSTFNNYDPESRHIAIAPTSPCPVLFGIRGERPGDLIAAFRTIQSEGPDRWLVFETNQGTDDHLLNEAPLVPGTSIAMEGTLCESPRTLQGGHVVLNLERTNGERVDATVYEPAKTLRRVARSLAPRDRVRILGAVRDVPRTVNVEKIRVLSLAPSDRPRAIALGWHEPPVSARRHLAKPLKRMRA